MRIKEPTHSACGSVVRADGSEARRPIFGRRGNACRAAARALAQLLAATEQAMHSAGFAHRQEREARRHVELMVIAPNDISEAPTLAQKQASESIRPDQTVGDTRRVGRPDEVDGTDAGPNL